MVPSIHYQQGAGFKWGLCSFRSFSTEIWPKEGCASLTEVALWRGASSKWPYCMTCKGGEQQKGTRKRAFIRSALIPPDSFCNAHVRCSTHGHLDHQRYLQKLDLPHGCRDSIPCPKSTAYPCCVKKWRNKAQSKVSSLLLAFHTMVVWSVPCCFSGAVIMKNAFLCFADAIQCCSIAGLVENPLLLGHTASLLATPTNKARLTNSVVLTSP